MTGGRSLRVAFYAPMKPPDDPRPSGDRTVARLFWQALTLSGHRPVLASRLVSRDPQGDEGRQRRLAVLGERMARRSLRREPRPDLWFTYHNYYKAPDWIGPRVADALGIPYVVAEASLAPKRAHGAWAFNYRGVVQGLARADAIIPYNRANEGCLPHPERHRTLRPFLDPAPFRRAGTDPAAARTALAARWGLDPGQPWILVCAMMRRGDKLASYRLLAEALNRLPPRPWLMLVAGDGPAAEEVQSLFGALPPDRIRWLGRLDPAELPGFYAAGDLLAWPAVREAFGMSLLEAQAAGLPVVAGAELGVPAVVADGETGLLVAPRDTAALASAIDRLLQDEGLRRRLGRAAAACVLRRHSLAAAAKRLDEILQEVTP